MIAFVLGACAQKRAQPLDFHVFNKIHIHFYDASNKTFEEFQRAGITFERLDSNPLNEYNVSTYFTSTSIDSTLVDIRLNEIDNNIHSLSLNFYISSTTNKRTYHKAKNELLQYDEKFKESGVELTSDESSNIFSINIRTIEMIDVLKKYNRK